MVIGIFFLIRSQPVFMVRMLILITIIYSFFLYVIIGGYWFGYAMVMVILRGVLVVFTYIVRLFPNERFEIYNIIYVVFFIIVFLGGEYIIYGGDYRMVRFNLWVRYIRMFNLFLVVFLLRIILIVIWVRMIDEGAIRVV